MVKVKKTLKKALGKLLAEMAKPKTTASVQRAQHSVPGGNHRKLELIDAFHGYACNWCGCRFPEATLFSNTPKSFTAARERRRLATERKKQFAAHLCSP